MSLLLSALSLFLTVSNAQTSANKNQLLSYDDGDGYMVLSTIIDLSASQQKAESVSIFQNTLSGASLNGLKNQCLDRVPPEFQKPAEDFNKKASTKFLLKERFSLKKKYKLVASTSNSLGVFSVSAVGFDDTKTHAIVLVKYLVRPATSLFPGGGSLFYLMRKSEVGWKEAAEFPECGRIY